jgi:hypothetical protein
VNAPIGFLVSTSAASTWQEGRVTVISINNPVVIQTDETTLRANSAVVWMEPIADSNSSQRISIALIGNAQISSGGATRSGDRLYATTIAKGDIRVEADRRIGKDESDSALYRQAVDLRSLQEVSPEVLTTAPSATQPAPIATTQKAPRDPLANIPAGTGARITSSSPHLVEGLDQVTYVLPNVSVFYRWPDGATAEMYAENAVAFTTLIASDPKNDSLVSAQAALDAIYLEGDVRVMYFPAPATADKVGEQKLNAQSAYFRISDRTAVLTQAVLHSEDVRSGTPFVVRAKTIKMLADGQYEAQHVQLTTSQFARPSYEIQASKIYVHDTSFRAENAIFKFVGVPLFYMPVAGGQTTGRGAPIRDISVEKRGNFGIGVETTWGLFETLGMDPPAGLDAEYRVDYLSDRGPSGGLSAKYQGGLITDTTHQPIDFVGDLDSYFVYEHGVDQLGSGRSDVDPGYKSIRGVAGIRHQHFFPDGWQLQLQSYYVSDATFLEGWSPYTKQFDQGLPKDSSLYLKHQEGNSAFTLLANADPNGIVTTADLQQEQFTVQHLPEVGYHLIGEGIGPAATLYSDNLLSALSYKMSDATLAEQGFNPPNSTPGIPSLGTTGTTDDTILRGDFRQELDFPFSIGQLRVVPYVVGRYTAYSEGVAGDQENRVLGAVGTRLTTAFWRIDDNAHSELFDIHRMRHIVEPEVHLFAGATNVDRNNLFIFEEPIDDVSGIRAIDIAMHQRWQTKRGGPGRWRTTDLFTLNVDAAFFANRPREAPIFDGLPGDQRPPDDFRGLFLASSPEASLPRNSLNADGTWRLSDTTVIIGDLQYNLDVNRLSTASIGLNVQREDRLRYYVGFRYIEPFDANIATVAVDYQLTPKYLISMNQSYDFGPGENVVSSFVMSRKFDRFYLQVGVSVDRRNDQSTFGINFIPEGVSVGSATVQEWIPQ